MRSLILVFANDLLLSLHSQQQRLEQIHGFSRVGFWMCETMAGNATVAFGNRQGIVLIVLFSLLNFFV